MVENDEGGYIVPQQMADNIRAWFKLVMGEHSQDVLRRLTVTRQKFLRYGAQNEEVSEYVLQVLNYILCDTDDDPTSDWNF